MSIINSSSNKLNSLLHIIDDKYVDTVNINDIVEKAMPQILSELDPHSVYIAARDMEIANDELKGSFSGIGIEFTIRQDTIHVQNVISNGPAERAGLLAGDKIVSIDGKPFVGKEVTNEEAMHRLKGPKDTQVKLGIMRNKGKIKHFVVVRGEIPTKSVSATYMLNEETGYIRIKNFGEKTYSELLISLAELSQQEAKNLVIDLRGNNRSDGRGSYQQIPLVVLIDEATASASEILAGAIQDNDRGTVIGRRSFGKGLVQQPIAFNDGSMVRLTIARYYSPSGRCIQKPYVAGANKSYEEDLLTRYEHGEFFSQDSIKHDGPAYFTSIGRTVYGGGGITPDIFVAEDTTDMTSYYKEASLSGLILQYAFEYTDEHRSKLKQYEDMTSLAKYLDHQNVVEQFAAYGEQHGLRRRNLMIQKSHHLLDRYLKSRIIYNMQSEQSWIEYLNQDDVAINTALKIFKDSAAFPQKPKGKGKNEARPAKKS